MSNATSLISQCDRIRKSKNLSFDELAKKSGYQRQVLTKWVKRQAIPRLDNFINMANTLGYELKLVPIQNTNSDLNERLLKSEEMKRKWQDPEYRKKMSEKAKAQWRDPSFQEKMKQARKEQLADPEFIERCKRAAKKRNEMRLLQERQPDGRFKKQD